MRGPKLTYANVMATIAVFVALGGGAYAAITVPRDSVNTNSIRNGQVIVNGDDPAKAFARRTSSDGMIETEESSGRFAIFDVAFGAVEAVGKEFCLAHFRFPIGRSIEWTNRQLALSEKKCDRGG